eukprot:COSAG03_NODE_4026_length_1715_cov_1.465347_2_plen_376_part_01
MPFRLGRPLFYYNVFVGPFAWYYTQSTRNIGDPTWNSAEAVLTGVLFTCAMTPLIYISYLPRVIADGGPLQQLGAGKKRVMAGQMKRLALWRAVLGVVAAGCFMFGAFFFYSGPTQQARNTFAYKSAVDKSWAYTQTCQAEALASDDVRHTRRSPALPFLKVKKPRAVILQQESARCLDMTRERVEQEVYSERFFLLITPVWVFAFLLGYPCAMGWFFAMKVAVCLAEDDANELLRRATAANLVDDARWTTQVAQPAIELASNTMAYLSDGWGGGVLIAGVPAMAGSIYNFLEIFHSLVVQGRHEDFDKYFACVAAALVPLALAKDLAHVSSLCDQFTERLNNLRMNWTSTTEAQAMHARLFPLQCTLKGKMLTA